MGGRIAATGRGLARRGAEEANARGERAAPGFPAASGAPPSPAPSDGTPPLPEPARRR